MSLLVISVTGDHLQLKFLSDLPKDQYSTNIFQTGYLGLIL